MGAVVISGELIQMSPIVLQPTKGGTKPNIFHPLFQMQSISRSYPLQYIGHIKHY